MRTQLLQNKLAKYLAGKANPAEIKQVQTWLSCTGPEIVIPEKEKQQLEKEIRKEIHEITGTFPETSVLSLFSFIKEKSH